MNRNSTTARITYCALFAALTAVFSQIAIPVEPVPFNLATLAVFLTGGLLGPVWGGMSMVTYVALGAVGVPVFAGFSGGIGILAGPTGGYIIGYIAAAWLIGFICTKWGKGPLKAALAMAVGMAACYLFGTLWYMVSMKTPFFAALMSCVVPFLLFDAAKIAVAAATVTALQKRLAW